MFKTIGGMACLVLAAAAFAADPQAKPAARPVPALRKQGTATQLMVDGKPFLMLGGELHNSSASSMEYMKPIWPRLKAMHLNTVLATVSWELVEPREHEFDFRLVDGLLRDARANNMRLVLLWFGSWKNGVSSYVPLWVKKDLNRFPRAQRKDGENLEVLSTFSEAGRDADAAAFAALMRHLKLADPQRTVITMQVENEVGILGDSRDRSPAAEAAWAKAVPAELLAYFQKHRDTLLPETTAVWGANGFKTSGTWAEVFGTTPEAEELFMAWHYGRYIDRVTAAGKKEYPLPMYVNAWLVQNETQKPGGYPSGGPVSRVMDTWRAAAPAIDLFAPDIYLPDFKAVTASYHRSGNPLFIPEARGGSVGAANAFWAFAQHDAICFSPFGIDGIAGMAPETAPREDPLGASYALLAELAPTITKYNGEGKMAGILPGDDQSQSLVLGGYRLEIQFIGRRDQGPPGTPPRAGATPERGFGLVIATAPDEYLVAGTGFTVRFAAESPGPKIARIASIEEGRFADGKWIPGRRLNGDENGGGVRMMFGSRLGIQRIQLYRHD
jgi:hypothetical protein